MLGRTQSHPEIIIALEALNDRLQCVISMCQCCANEHGAEVDVRAHSSLTLPMLELYEFYERVEAFSVALAHQSLIVLVL